MSNSLNPLPLTLDYSELFQRPDVMARSTLQTTFELLRKQCPSLSLSVRNLLTTNQPLTTDFTSPPSAELFRITLPANEIGLVINQLTQAGHLLLEQSPEERDKLMQIKGLITEWMKLAEWIIMQNGTEEDN